MISLVVKILHCLIAEIGLVEQHVIRVCVEMTDVSRAEVVQGEGHVVDGRPGR